MSTILVTGSAGFIGYHVASRLLARGDQVVGVDNLNPYYDVKLKRARRDRLETSARYRHVDADLADRSAIDAVFAHTRPDKVINLAAQAGVRYAAENPHIYVASNVTGFLHILEGCRTGSSTWCLLPPVQCTGRTGRCPSPSISRRSIR